MSQPGAWCAPSETLYDAASLNTRLMDIISLPGISVARGGIRYNHPETQEQQIARIAYERAMVEWNKGLPGTGSVKDVWLAVRDDGYDSGITVLEVCATKERAIAVCEHEAARPDRWRPQRAPIDWEGNSGNNGSDYYYVEPKPVMA